MCIQYSFTTERDIDFVINKANNANCAQHQTTKGHEFGKTIVDDIYFQ